LKEKTKSTTKVDNWLDRSEERYGKKLVYHIKSNFKVLSVFLPLMIYGILDMNINTVWILQASLMNGELGNGNIVEPKKMLIANPVLILIWIPLICLVIYPVCARYNLITTPLQRIGCGGMFVGVAYFISAFISLAIESNVASLPSKGECHLRMFNPLTCSININAPPYVDNVEIVSMGYKFVNVPKVAGINIVDYKITGCEHVISNVSGHDFLLIEEKSISYFITTKGLNRYIDKIKKYSQDAPKIR
jgi:solute carrier family 15 oligopeptide transporter 1